MNIHFGNAPLPHNSALTIGNFDGVHSGHRHILQTLHQQAQARQLIPTAIIFEPQPAEYFASLSGQTMPKRLSPLRDKLRLLAQTQFLQRVLVLRFNASLAQLFPQQFIQQILIQQLHTRYLLIGDDFRFGYKRTGDFQLLQQQSAFHTEKTPSILIADLRASSTAIRQALQQGKLDFAQQILGHPYNLSGRVKHGQKLGRTLNCPTANIHLPHHHYALQGIFIVQAQGTFGKRFGVASFGSNPTVCTTPQPKLEVHLFDFQGDLYGKQLTVHFLHKLRDEQKFNSLPQLQQQIYQDIQQAKHWLAHH